MRLLELDPETHCFEFHGYLVRLSAKGAFCMAPINSPQGVFVVMMGDNRVNRSEKISSVWAPYG